MIGKGRGLAATSGLILGLLMVGINGSGAEPKGDVFSASDLGPEEIDVSKYPEKHQKTYRTTLNRCIKCHGRARFLNSSFTELSKEEITKLKKERPDVFDDNVFMAEEKLWRRYVKRMMRKPGSGIRKKEAKKIHEFLVYDSKVRKTGKNLDKWIKFRRKLLKKFKKLYPAKYEKQYGKKK